MDATSEHVWFMDDEAFEETERPGFRRRIVTGQQLQLCLWRIRADATGSVLHRHPDHEQAGIVVRGGLTIRIGDPETAPRATLGVGEMYVVPPGVWHGDSVFLGDADTDECWLMDVFVPPRQDWGTPAEAGLNGYSGTGAGA